MRSAAVLTSLVLVASLSACRGHEASPPAQATDSTGTAAAAAPPTDLSTDTATATNPGSPGGKAIVPSTVAGATVLVTITDGRIVVANPDQIPPGPAIMTVTNDGPGVHSLVVSGEGINRGPSQESLTAHTSSSFDVVFKPGTYTLYCPILNHRQKGESIELVIKTAVGTRTDIDGGPRIGSDIVVIRAGTPVALRLITAYLDGRRLPRWLHRLDVSPRRFLFSISGRGNRNPPSSRHYRL